MSKPRSRRSPRHHTVHTEHSRYDVGQYGRGEGSGEAEASHSEEDYKPYKILAGQLRAMDRFYAPRYSIRQLVKIDDNTLRLIARPRGRKLNIDIKYNHGTDYYDLVAYKIKRDMSVWKVYEMDSLGGDQLPDILNSIVNKKQTNRNELVAEGFSI